VRDLSNNAKFHLANLKSHFCDRREVFTKLSEEVKTELIEKKYWDNWKKDLTQKSYETYREWFEEVYVGSMEEKLNYDSQFNTTTDYCDFDGETD